VTQISALPVLLLPSENTLQTEGRGLLSRLTGTADCGATAGGLIGDEDEGGDCGMTSGEMGTDAAAGAGWTPLRGETSPGCVEYISVG
jgi:hypothetical protein